MLSNQMKNSIINTFKQRITNMGFVSPKNLGVTGLTTKITKKEAKARAKKGRNVRSQSPVDDNRLTLK